MRVVDRSIDKLSDRLDRLEVEKEMTSSSSSESEFQFGLTEEELEKLTPIKKYKLKFNWYLHKIMPYYKAEVMAVHNLTSEEYDRRVLEGDQSIYLPQPNRKFESTSLHRLNISFSWYCLSLYYLEGCITSDWGTNV